MRVDHEPPHAGLDGRADLVPGLGHAVEHDLLAARTRLAGPSELATGVDLDVDAAAPHLTQEPQVRTGLAGKEDLGARWRLLNASTMPVMFAPDAARREQEERRCDPPGESTTSTPSNTRWPPAHRDVVVEMRCFAAPLHVGRTLCRAIILSPLDVTASGVSGDADGTRHPPGSALRRHLRRHASRLLEAVRSRLPLKGQANAGMTGRHVPSAHL